jgi:hypothetical protein
MRILLIAETDNAQQHYLLAKAMRDHLDWDAKSMVVHNTFLGYPTDWTTEENIEEAAEFAKNTNLFIFQDYRISFDELPLHKYCGPKNTIINGTGSRMRARIDSTRADQYNGWAVVPMLCDTTLSTKLCAPPFENWIVPIERIRELSEGIEKTDKVSICHAPTKLGYKGTDILEAVLKNYTDSGEIEYKRITGMKWEDAIKEKAKYRIIFDSMGDTHYNAGNSLEGLVQEQTVISNIDPWCYCLHPDLPMETVWNKELKSVIKNAIEKEKMGGTFVEKERAKEWVTEHFSAEKQITKWKYFIKWVMER